MRNLKKILALVLALVMTMSVMSVASAANYTDADDINEDYWLSVELLDAMGILTGYADGTFRPEGTIKRSEMAALIYRITTGDVKNEHVGLYNEIADFTDTADHWAASYIGYCATKGYIKGYALANGKYEFRPDANVTGVEALIMILRAIGYNKSDVFSGKDWKLTALSYGQDNGITTTIKGYALVGDATREIVAEMIHNALFAAMVTYTPAGGYTRYKNVFVANTLNDTLGEKVFDLTYHYITNGTWGRPVEKWTFDTNAKKYEHALTPIYKKNVAVDECDIAFELGKTAPMAIESGWIDGVKLASAGDITSNGVATIAPLETKSFLGGQGTQLEIYDLTEAYDYFDYDIDGNRFDKTNAGYRVIEINTYLAEVVKVTKATTDKNGHPTAASVTLNVIYGDEHDVDDSALLTLSGNPYEKGDFVLVTVSGAETATAAIVDHDLAIRDAGGNLTDLTKEKIATNETELFITKPGMHTFNYKTDKVEADTFALYYEGKDANGVEQDIAWDLLLDKDGNLIGLTPSEISYLAIERIEWQDKAGQIGGGYALADVILSNGEKVNNVTISSVDGIDVMGDNSNPEIDVAGENVTVSEDYRYNWAVWSMHIMSYAVEADGSYALFTHEDDVTDDEDGDVEFKKGTVRLLGLDESANNRFVVNNKTVFLFWDEETLTFTKYVGKNNVPSFSEAKVCVLENEDCYATLVLITECKLPDNTFIAFLGDVEVDRTKNDKTEGTLNGYDMYKMGSTTKDRYWDIDDSAKVDEDWTAGMYEVTVNSKGIIEEIAPLGSVFFEGLTSGAMTINDTDLAEKMGLFLGWSKITDGTTMQLNNFAWNDVANDDDEKTKFTTEEDGYYIDEADTTDGMDVNDYEDATYYSVVFEADGTATLKSGDVDDVEGKIVVVAYEFEDDQDYTDATAKYVYIVEFEGNGVEIEEEEEEETADITTDVTSATYADGSFKLTVKLSETVDAAGTYDVELYRGTTKVSFEKGIALTNTDTLNIVFDYDVEETKDTEFTVKVIFKGVQVSGTAKTVETVSEKVVAN